MVQKIYNKSARDQLGQMWATFRSGTFRSLLVPIIRAVLSSFIVEGVTAAELPSGGSALVDVYVGDTAGATWAAHPDSHQVTGR